LNPPFEGLADYVGRIRQSTFAGITGKSGQEFTARDFVGWFWIGLCLRQRGHPVIKFLLFPLIFATPDYAWGGQLIYLYFVCVI
jgi:hypothetical protein